MKIQWTTDKLSNKAIKLLPSQTQRVILNVLSKNKDVTIRYSH